jgi:hypothetical protein
MTSNRYERLKARLIQANSTNITEDNSNAVLGNESEAKKTYGSHFERLKTRLNGLENNPPQNGMQKDLRPDSSKVPAASWSNLTPEASLSNLTNEYLPNEKEYPNSQISARIETNVINRFLKSTETGVPSMSKSYTDLSSPSTFEESQDLNLEDSLLDSVYASTPTKNDYNLEEDMSVSPVSLDFESLEAIPSPSPEMSFSRKPQLSMNHLAEPKPMYDTEYTNNVKTLINLVNNLPEGVTKQTGAQIIRLTMEAMGIAMEEVLSEAQSAQSEMLEAVRGNIKKIEEYKTVIRKLETDIKHYQGKANELSEIIDLFILSSSKISE